MTGSFDAELGSIFNEYEKSSAGTSETSARELFRQRFRDVRKATFVPALESIAASLATRGVRTKLLTEKEMLDSGGEPFVTLLLQIDLAKSDGMSFDRTNFNRQHPDSKYPSLSIQSDGDRQRVVIVRSTSAPGYAGSSHEDASTVLGDIDESLLQQQVLGILRELYATNRR